MKKVITGLGVVTPIGLDVKTLYKNILIGNSCFEEEQRAYKEYGYGLLSGQVSLEDKNIINKELEIYNCSQATKYALYAINQALGDAQITNEERKVLRFAIILGNNEAESEEFDYYLEANCFLHNNYVSHSICDMIADIFGLNTVRKLCIHNTCASSNMALEIAGYLLDHNQCDVCIIGGADAFSKKVHAGFSSLGAISKDKSRPFSINRDGINISEGSGIIILEKEGRCKFPYCEYVATGSSNDAKFLAAPDAEGILRAYKVLFDKSKIKPSEVDYIMSHGTGTVVNDNIESEVIKTIYDSKLKGVCSIKNRVGHMMASCGIIGSIIIAMSFRYCEIPGINDNYPIDKTMINSILTENRYDNNVKYFINHSFGFGGNNSIALFGRGRN